MAQAAYCSQCGTNVFVGPDGRCPNGHGPESLSNYYEVAEEAAATPPAEPSTPAQWATAGAVEPPSAFTAPTPEYNPPATYPTTEPAYGSGLPPATPPKKSKTGLIIGIVAVLLVCCILTVVGGVYGFNTLKDTTEDVVTETTDTTTDSDTTDGDISGEEVTPDENTGTETDPNTDTGGEIDTEALVEEMTPEVEGLIAQFYPSFTMNDFAIAGDPAEDAFDVHIIAESNDVSGFFITFFAERSTVGGSGAADITYTDSGSGTTWTHQEGKDHGLLDFFGANAVTDSATKIAIMEAFMDPHPDGDMNITDVNVDSGTQVTMEGIPDGDLESWYDDFSSFKSVFTYTTSWAETSFEEF